MLADPINRWSADKGDYNPDQNLFIWLQNDFSQRGKLKTDMFASPGNSQLPQFVTRWPHWQAVAIDALQCPLNNLGMLYANPPWAVIGKWLHRLRENPKVICLVGCTYWVSTTCPTPPVFWFNLSRGCSEIVKGP